MSDPMNDAEFEAYIGRRSRLSRHYRDLSSDFPPTELDEAVMHRARSALELHKKEFPERQIYIGWMAPVAFAATVVLVFSVVLQIVIRPATRVPEKDAVPLTAAAPPSASSVPLREEPYAAGAQHELDKRAAAPAYGHETEGGIFGVAPAPDVRDRARAAAPQPRAEQKASTRSDARVGRDLADAGDAKKLENSKEKVDSVTVTGNASSVSAMPSLVPPPGDPARARDNPETWLAYITKLRSSGQASLADAEMKLFLKQHPDYFRDHPLPDDAR